MFIAKITRTVKKHSMLVSGEKVVVGVSGGPDSMALLSVLHQMRETYNLQLLVAHLNHGFRGKEAERDAQFVHDRAQRLGLPCEVPGAHFRHRCGRQGRQQARTVKVAAQKLNRPGPRPCYDLGFLNCDRLPCQGAACRISPDDTRPRR